MEQGQGPSGSAGDQHTGGNPTQAPESGALGATTEEQTSQQSGSGTTGTERQSEPPGSRSAGSGGGARAAGGGRASSAPGSGPFSVMRRFSEDMDRLFEGFFGSAPFGRDPWGLGSLVQSTRWPELEVHQEGKRWIVQADVPGLRREDVHVEVRDDQLVISGERRSQNERSEGGFYRSERNYGKFTRAIPLPEGANVDSASASFENGVLRIELEVPEQRQRARRIEVREGKPG